MNARGLIRTSSDVGVQPRGRVARGYNEFILAKWPSNVAWLREMYSPLGTVFPSVPHEGWCTCLSHAESVRVEMRSCTYTAMCPYGGQCGNGLRESDKIFLGRNVRTRALCVVAGEDIPAGEVIGQYLGEMEHVSLSRANRPRNGGFRLVMNQRPERPNRPVRVAINAERLGGLMRL